MDTYIYLLINIGCILIPFLFSFYPKHAFYKEWIPFFISCFTVAIFFLIWDQLFTEAEIWGFNSNYITGVYLGNLPIEEILFFLCIPYACSFTYFSIQYLIPNKKQPIYLTKINYILSLCFVVLGLILYNKWYSFLTFLFLGLFLMYMHLKKINLFYYYITYLIILPFFFISNGILTGSFLKAPIVWYNNTENLGFRLFTIPIEDAFYGMLLIFSNIYLYQYFKEKLHAKN